MISRILAFVAVMAISVIAFGQDGSADAVKPWESFLIDIFAGGGTILLGGIGWLLKKLFDFLAEKTKVGLLAQVDDYLLGIVTHLYNSQIEHWKTAKSDGKLTRAERDEAARLAIESAKQFFDLDQLSKLFGQNVDSGIAQRVELAVTRAKNAGAAAKGPAANPT